MLRLLFWNLGQRKGPWRWLVGSGADVALVQEAKPPPDELAGQVVVDEEPWQTAGWQRSWRAAVVGLSDRVLLRPRSMRTTESAGEGDLVVSRPGTLSVCDVTIEPTGELVTVASMYAAWERPRSARKSGWIYADGSAHRLISDLSALIGHEKGQRIIAAGDLNILHGYGEGGSAYWKARYDTVFSRMDAIGLPFVGPQAPQGGRQAEPWPEELPEDSRNVPTFRTKIGQPETATRQLDFVFASEELRDRLTVRALNRDEEWGPSDHCRVLIELAME